MNMGHIYLRLIKTGCVLFKNWTATIYCDPDNKYTIRVNFGLNCENIFGRRDKALKTINSLNKTVKFLQNSYDEWLAHITEKRDQFSCLNYFTITQNVMLRTEMAKLIKNGYKSSDDRSEYRGLFDMLHNINKNASIELLEQANSFVFHKEQNNFVEPDKAAVPEETTAIGCSTELKQDVRKQLEDLGFSG